MPESTIATLGRNTIKQRGPRRFIIVTPGDPMKARYDVMHSGREFLPSRDGGLLHRYQPKTYAWAAKAISMHLAATGGQSDAVPH